MTLPPAASAQPDQTEALAAHWPAYIPAPTSALISPAASIFDGAAVHDAIAGELADLRDPKSIRTVAVKHLTAANAQGRDVISAAIADAPRAARPAVSAYAWLTDCIVSSVLHIATTYLHPSVTPTESERIAVLAVGGYGRAEMAPASDVDLLFLTPYKMTAWAESVIESMLYIFWDLHLKVGHSSRTVKDCVRLGREDYTIRTALLEHRHIGGHEPLSVDLGKHLRADLFKGTGPEFIEAKLAERADRHKKQGGQRYVVEPNVKEGKGGLRDLQSLFWIAKYLHNAKQTKDLVKLKVFNADEYDQFERAESFLMATRNQLHLITGRAMDQLTFDLQVEVAERLGYVDANGRRGVEHFMQDYFRHATRVGELTRVFLTLLEAQHIKQAPSLQGFFRRRRALKGPFKLIQNRLQITDEKVFLKDKLNLLRIFAEALRTGYLIHPDAMRLIVNHLDMIDDDMRTNPEAVQIFLDLMLKYGNPERGLRRMNELGVLAAFMPEFEPIVAMMQFNMYHAYTVDEHTIQCISNLAQIERGELVEELPIASSILKSGVNRKVLYIALLLHDIGKGRPEDHAVLGAQMARKITPRLGLKPEECETVEWLVRYHLLMSDIAQKRDLSDPRTVNAFAKMVKTTKRLDLLTVLTVCDIRGVGPDTWNNWKAMLLRELHSATTHALEHGIEAVNRSAREDEAKRDLRTALDTWDKKDLRIETGRHYGPYWQGLPTDAHCVFASLLKGIEDHEIRIDLKPDVARDATRVCFVMADHPGIFSRLAGALALVGANVVDARTYTSKDGYATAVFWLQDNDGAPYEAARLPRLRTMIQKTLHGEVITRDALKDRDKVKKRESKFAVPTVINFDNEGSEIYTIVEIETRDRPGLLYDLTRTLANNHISIASAAIATYGAQVVDTFYVKDMFGLKMHAPTKQAALERKLREAIQQGVERAKADT